VVNISFLLPVLALLAVANASAAQTKPVAPKDPAYDQTMVKEYFAGCVATHLKHNQPILPQLRTIRLAIEVPKGVSDKDKANARAKFVKQLADGGITVADKAPYVMHLAPGLLTDAVANGPGTQRYMDKATFLIVQREVSGEPKPVVYMIPGSSMHYIGAETLVDMYCDWVKDKDYR
jgi:hypothetical protein